MSRLLPLEEYFQRLADVKYSDMPHMRNDYFTQYQQMLNVFRNSYYDKIDAGLAALSQAPGFYTAHDSTHFDEVVVHAGNLLNIGAVNIGELNRTSLTALNAYEVYLLLAAIRVHDVGNMYGRDRHEKKCFGILQDMGTSGGVDSTERKIIAKIAQAHGGKTSTGSKDTIGDLEVISQNGHVSYRPRLLAGIVRIADEICENGRRAAGVLLNSASLPKHSEIYHRYAASITGNRWDHASRTLTIAFEVQLSHIERAWGCEVRKSENEDELSEVFLVDEIFARLEKMDRERRYCNIYTREAFTIDAIKATLDILDDTDHEVIDSIRIPVLSDSGYPDDGPCNLKRTLAKYCGAGYGAGLRAKTEGLI